MTVVEYIVWLEFYTRQSKDSSTKSYHSKEAEHKSKAQEAIDKKTTLKLGDLLKAFGGAKQGKELRKLDPNNKIQ